MKIVIVGLGKIGYVLAQQLSREGHDIIAVDTDPAVLKKAQDKLDVAVVAGNGASADVQRTAEVPDADLLISVVDSDEINLLCCLVAHKLGCVNVIARVRNPEYDSQMSLLDAELGLSLAVNPEKSAAYEIYHLLQFSSFLHRDLFAGGRAETVEFKLGPDSKLINSKLSELGGVFKKKAVVCTVERDGNVVIPSGDFELLEGDKITVASSARNLPALASSMGIKKRKIDSVLIAGGSRIAEYLARLLVASDSSVTIIEQNLRRCEELNELIPKANIICGNAIDQELLVEEGIREAQAVVTLTGMDEENLIISMFANFVGVPKTVTKINMVEFSDVFTGMGVDTIVSPKLLTANEIIRYARAISVEREGGIEALYRIANGKAEALGFSVPQEGRFLNISLADLQLKPNVVVAIIIRGRKVIIPKGDDCFMPGDNVIIISGTDKAYANFTDIFDFGSEVK